MLILFPAKSSGMCRDLQTAEAEASPNRPKAFVLGALHVLRSAPGILLRLRHQSPESSKTIPPARRIRVRHQLRSANDCR